MGKFMATLILFLFSNFSPAISLCYSTNNYLKHEPWETLDRSDSVVECLTQFQGVAGSSLTGGTALCR